MEKILKLVNGIKKTSDYFTKTQNRKDAFIKAVLLTVCALLICLAACFVVAKFKMPPELKRDSAVTEQGFNDIQFQIETLRSGDWTPRNFEYCYLSIPDCDYIFTTNADGVITESLPRLEYLKGMRVDLPRAEPAMIFTHSLITKNNQRSNVYEIWYKKGMQYLCVAINTTFLYKLEMPSNKLGEPTFDIDFAADRETRREVYFSMAGIELIFDDDKGIWCYCMETPKTVCGNNFIFSESWNLSALFVLFFLISALVGAAGFIFVCDRITDGTQNDKQ